MLNTVGFTSVNEEYVESKSLPANARFFTHLKTINKDPKKVASHLVIQAFIEQNGRDYRYADAPHPIENLQDREKDNVEVGTI